MNLRDLEGLGGWDPEDNDHIAGLDMTFEHASQPRPRLLSQWVADAEYESHGKFLRPPAAACLP